MTIDSPFYTQLIKEMRMRVSQEAVETINNLVFIIEEMYPDNEQYQKMLNIDDVLAQAKLTVQKLTKEGE
jgi:hypothetical protein